MNVRPRIKGLLSLGTSGRRSKKVAISLALALLFWAATACLWCQGVGQGLDLSMWFRLRGQKAPSRQVAIVNLDIDSGVRLGLGPLPKRWPRSIYARLIQRLKELGAEVIALDVDLSQRRDEAGTKALVRAIQEAGNVILFQPLSRRRIEKDSIPRKTSLLLETLKPLPREIHKAAVAVAPFPLPKIPVRLLHFWTFKESAGGIPTLPTVTLALSALKERKVREELEKLVPEAFKAHIGGKPPEPNSKIVDFLMELRQVLLSGKLGSGQGIDSWLLELEQKSPLLARLLRVCAGPSRPFLNLYGPPGTINTIPSWKILSPGQNDASAARLTSFIRGKVIFVGAARREPSHQKDGFYTAFSRPDGLDISGVEIAATAFSNMLKGHTLSPANNWLIILVCIGLGLVTGGAVISLGPLTASLMVLSFVTLYLMAGLFLFETQGVFLPFSIPLVFPSLPTYLGLTIFRSVRINRERQNIKEAFRHYLPKPVVEELARDRALLKGPPKKLYGVCLMTDAERYTTASEGMDPGELAKVMNTYFEGLFRPVKEHGGTISDVTGDSMLAIWTGNRAEEELEEGALSAAIDLIKWVETFNQKGLGLRLPTRVGIHSGILALGNIGALDHYEFTPIGDIVNTTSRIEGLNKYLGTRVLASEAIISKTNKFYVIKLGAFLLTGKSIPIVIYEIIGRNREITRQHKQISKHFSQGLRALNQGHWKMAIENFSRISHYGPAQFYIDVAKKYSQSPPDESWDGVIRVDKK